MRQVRIDAISLFIQVGVRRRVRTAANAQIYSYCAVLLRYSTVFIYYALSPPGIRTRLVLRTYPPA